MKQARPENRFAAVELFEQACRHETSPAYYKFEAMKFKTRPAVTKPARPKTGSVTFSTATTKSGTSPKRPLAPFKSNIAGRHEAAQLRCKTEYSTARRTPANAVARSRRVALTRHATSGTSPTRPLAPFKGIVARRHESAQLRSNHGCNAARRTPTTDVARFRREALTR